MKLRKYILDNYNGRNVDFAKDNGMTGQQVGVMVKKGIYHIYDGMLVIARTHVKPIKKPVVGDAKDQLDLLGE